MARKYHTDVNPDNKAAEQNLNKLTRLTKY
jgi:DnaJ-class molecular chaperone